MKKITFKGDTVTGELQLSDAEMVCVPAKEKYNEVDLCFRSGMNIQVAGINVGWLDYENKKILGYEIENRWNQVPKLIERIKELEAMLSFLVENDSINDGSIDQDVSELLKK